MESEEGGDSGRNLKMSVCARKGGRKRAYKRRKAASLSTTFINMAEARREIFNALQLHRSSSSSSSSSVTNHAVSYITSNNAAPGITVPAVLSTPVPAVELLEVEWFDNVSASYAWWMAFLSSLDRQNTGGDQTVSVPCFAPRKSGSDSTDPDPIADEWVVFPPAEECASNVHP